MSIKNMPTTTAVEAATEEQIGHIKDLSTPRLRQLPREQAQVIITNGGAFQTAFSAMVETLIERFSNMIMRRAKVSRDRTPNEVISATDRKPYVDDAVVRTMPRGDGNEVEVVFFKLGRWISDADLAKEYEARGLKPDPYAQAAINEADPAFADEHPNGCHWQRTDGGYNFLAFDQWHGGRRVSCDRNCSDWNDHWWFGGVRK